MASNPPDYSRWQNEPSIVIDPGLYTDARPRLGKRVLWTSFAVVRTLACVGVLAVTLFAIAHADQWLANGHGDAHASETPAATRSVAAASPSPVVRELAVEVGAAPSVAQAIAEAAPAAGEGDMSEEDLHERLRRGSRFLHQRRLDEADAAYAEVLAARASHPGALSGRARVQLARGELDRALKLAQQSVRSAPSHAVYRLTLADILRACGEPAAADEELAVAARLSHKPMDRAAELLPGNPF